MHIHTFYYNTKIPTLALLLTILSFPSSSQVTFDEVAASAGLSMIASNVESLAWGDYNNDGWEDVYLSANGANTLMQNNGDGTFTNIIDTVGAQEMGWSVGAAFADFDNDGDLDLFLLNFGAAADNLFRNNGAANNYSYTNVAASAGLTSNTSSSRGVTLIDFNRDGLVDIYVDAIGPNLLYQNMGGLTFVEVATANGVAAEGTGVGAVMSDIDNNGWPDLFTGNRSSDPNRLYFNSATGFTDVTSNGIDKVGLGMGVVAFDYDNDLDVDLYWTTWPGAGPTANAFYENQNNQFVDVAVATGTTDTTGWGISANVGDANNDGWQDLFVSNGFDANTGPNVLFVNQGAAGNQTFFIQDMGAFDGRGVAWADFDNDGDLDALVTGGPAADNRLFKNTTVNLNQWLQLQLKGTIGNRSAIGARVEVNTNSGVYMQEVSGGAGRGSQNSLRLHFGLGAATQVNSIFVRWPNGNQQTYHYHGALNRKVAVVEDVIFANPFDSSALNKPLANIVSVSTTGSANNYTFNVGIASDDVACEQYADWWEVLDVNGLVHRRILAHSHATEQPFIRGSGPINIAANETVWIRAHMSNGGYGGTLFVGSVAMGFSAISNQDNWDGSIEFAAPQVSSCAF